MEHKKDFGANRNLLISVYCRIKHLEQKTDFLLNKLKAISLQLKILNTYAHEVRVREKNLYGRKPATECFAIVEKRVIEAEKEKEEKKELARGESPK